MTDGQMKVYRCMRSSSFLLFLSYFKSTAPVIRQQLSARQMGGVQLHAADEQMLLSGAGLALVYLSLWDAGALQTCSPFTL